MKTIIVYDSHTGFTAEYAAWLAEALGCDCKRLKEVNAAQLSEYERVIFGGWIMGGGIAGLDKLRGMATPYAVFAVGSAPAFEEVAEKVRAQNKLEEGSFFYFQGGLRFDKLSLPERLILKAVRKSLAKKTERDRVSDFMAEAMGSSFEAASRESLAPLIAYCG